MEPVLFSLLLVLTILFVITQATILLVFLRAFREFKKSHNPDEEAVKKLRLKSEEILRGALERANLILASAQKKGVDIIAKEEKTGSTLSDEYSKHLGAVQESLQESFERTANDADKALEEYLTQVGKTVADHMDQNEKILSDKAAVMTEQARKALDDMRGRTEGSIEKLTKDTQEMVRSEIDKELAMAHDELTEYKARRMKMIDERIIQMLEDVIKVTLEKKLSLVEQSELVYRALEEAKRENAFK